MQAIQSFGSAQPLAAQVQLPLQELRELRNRMASLHGFESTETRRRMYGAPAGLLMRLVLRIEIILIRLISLRKGKNRRDEGIAAV